MQLGLSLRLPDCPSLHVLCLALIPTSLDDQIMSKFPSLFRDLATPSELLFHRDLSEAR